MELMMSEHVPGACPSGTVAFVPAASTPDGLDQRLQSTGGAHTPGPWAVHCSHIYAPDGAIIAQVHNPGSKASDYPLLANRDLMAAAPDMLAALYALNAGARPSNWADDDLDPGHTDAWRQLDAAIAKATGR